MYLPIIVHKEDGADFGIIIPDLPGVFASGESLENAIEDAKEAIQLRFCDDIKCTLPHPSSLETIKANLSEDDEGWVSMLEIDEELILGKRPY